MPHGWKPTPAKKSNNNQLMIEGFIFWLFWPQFEELPVGLMALTVSLTIAVEKDIQQLIWQGLGGEHAAFIAMGLFVVLSGVMAAFYHLFSSAEKSREEKRLLIIIASLSCIFSGVIGGYYLYAAGGQGSILRLVGAWNCIQGLFLAILLYAKEINETAVSDDNASIGEAVTGLLTVSIIFALLKYGFLMHWVDTFSICVAISMNYSMLQHGWMFFAGKLRRKKKIT